MVNRFERRLKSVRSAAFKARPTSYDLDTFKMFDFWMHLGTIFIMQQTHYSC